MCEENERWMTPPWEEAYPLPPEPLEVTPEPEPILEPAREPALVP